MRVQMRTLLLSLAFSIGIAGTASAACEQEDVAGNWDLYIIKNFFIEEENEFGMTWGACAFRINPNGAIQTGTSCLGPDEVQVTGGRLALSPVCRARGRISLRVDGGASTAQLQVTRATLTVDKGLLIGVGIIARNGLPFIIQAVRR